MAEAPILAPKDETYYSNLVMNEKRTWHIKLGGIRGDGFIPQLGRCEFCRHYSTSGWMIQSDQGQIMQVGTNCVYTLCNLDRKQKRILAYSAKRYDVQRKYAKVVEYLKVTHPDANHLAPAWSAPWIAWNIMYKIEKTTGINRYWFDKYQDLTGIDLRLKKVKA
jgi:hypothetical protein